MKKKQLATPCVGVVGLGLIGGSISLGLQAAGWRVHGLAHHYSAAERAQKLGLVTQVSTNPAVLENCNVVVLALPLTALLQSSNVPYPPSAAYPYYPILFTRTLTTILMT